jgi:hypothetical protein
MWKVAACSSLLLLGVSCAHEYQPYFAGNVCGPGGAKASERSGTSTSDGLGCFVHAMRPAEQLKPGEVRTVVKTATLPKSASGRLTADENAHALAAVYSSEWSAIDAIKGDKASRFVGVALSGGGVRSASFSVGVLSALYDLGLLRHVGYLSTVSGGGFAGAWMMSYHLPPTHSGPIACDPTVDRDATSEWKRPSLDELFRPASNHRYHIAQHGEYLGYGNGHDSVSQVIVTAIKGLAVFPLHLTLDVILGYDYDIGPYRRFYRDGIRNAYLYALDDDGKRNFPLRAYPMSCFGPSAERPFWIQNMTLSLLDDSGQHHGRTGDAFELTPLWAGGSAVRYVKTPQLMVEDPPREVETGHDEGPEFLSWSPMLPRPHMAGSESWNRYSTAADNFWMSPMFGTAISGAALDGHGHATTAWTDFLLDTFGFDLGYYVNAWSGSWAHDPEHPVWAALDRAGFYFPLPFVYKAASSHRRTAGAARSLLMDGGMFDNLGIYALIRRGVRFIVVADGTQDSANDVCKRGFDQKWSVDHAALARSFSDMRKTEVLLKTDFGATVTWNWDELCKQFEPNEFLERPHAFVVSGTISNLPIDQYPEHDTVRIVYIKAAYVMDGQSLKSNDFVDAAKAADPAFANDTTGNQFFSEALVQSYSELGRSQIAGGSKGEQTLRRALGEFCRDFRVDRTACPDGAAGTGYPVALPIERDDTIVGPAPSGKAP